MKLSRALLQARFSEDLPNFADLDTLRELDEDIQKTLRRLMLSGYVAGYTRALLDADVRHTYQPGGFIDEDI